MFRALNGHAEVVEEAGEDDDELGLVVAHAVVLYDARHDAALDEEAKHPEADIRHDLEMYGTVVGHPEALHGVDVHGRPERVDLLVGVDFVYHLLQDGIVPHGKANLHSLARAFRSGLIHEAEYTSTPGPGTGREPGLARLGWK